MMTLPLSPTSSRLGLPTTHSTRGHTWRSVGPSFSHSHVRTGDTTRTTTTMRTAVIATALTAPEGTDSVPALPVTRAIVARSMTVVTNWETWTRATVATASGVATRCRLRNRRLRAAGPTPAGATSETTPAATWTRVVRHSPSFSGAKATRPMALPRKVSTPKAKVASSHHGLALRVAATTRSEEHT